MEIKYTSSLPHTSHCQHTVNIHMTKHADKNFTHSPQRLSQNDKTLTCTHKHTRLYATHCLCLSLHNPSAPAPGPQVLFTESCDRESTERGCAGSHPTTQPPCGGVPICPHGLWAHTGSDQLTLRSGSRSSSSTTEANWCRRR